MKSVAHSTQEQLYSRPLAEAWIEIPPPNAVPRAPRVASLAEAWIEISYRMRYM